MLHPDGKATSSQGGTAAGHASARGLPVFSCRASCSPIPSGARVSLDDYRDRWLILMFYPARLLDGLPHRADGPVAGRSTSLRRRDCDILGISTDSVASHEKWIATPRAQGGLGGLAFPLASDDDGSVCQAYGVYLPRQNMALRGLFIIDPNGVLQYQVVHNLSVGRRSDEVLRVLDGLQTGGLCPENWARDEATLDPTQVAGHRQRGRAIPHRGADRQRHVRRGLSGPRSDARADRGARRSFAPRGRIARGSGWKKPAAPRRSNHPNVCTVYAVDDSDGVSMIVMEHVEGQPLRKVVEGGQAAAGRGQEHRPADRPGHGNAHAHKIVHGDLKPANIMVTPRAW